MVIVANPSLGGLVSLNALWLADRGQDHAFAAPAAGASNGEEQTQTSPENGPQITLPDFRNSPIYFGGC